MKQARTQTIAARELLKPEKHAEAIREIGKRSAFLAGRILIDGATRTAPVRRRGFSGLLQTLQGCGDDPDPFA
jgi:hypothetical protein